MNRVSPKRIFSDNCLNVSDWVTETHDGRTAPYLCVYYDRFGFGMSLEQVQQAVTKLDALLLHNEASEYSSEIQIDRSGAEDGCVMFAFRPTANHASRYFDLPENAAWFGGRWQLASWPLKRLGFLKMPVSPQTGSW